MIKQQCLTRWPMDIQCHTHADCKGLAIVTDTFQLQTEHANQDAYMQELLSDRGFKQKIESDATGAGRVLLRTPPLRSQGTMPLIIGPKNQLSHLRPTKLSLSVCSLLNEFMICGAVPVHPARVGKCLRDRRQRHTKTKHKGQIKSNFYCKCDHG